MKNLLLLANYYPYGNKEQSFLNDEIAALRTRFHVVIASLHEPCDEPVSPLPEGVSAVPLSRAPLITGVLHALFSRDLWRETGEILRAGGGAKRILSRLRFVLGQYTAAHRFSLAIERQILPSFRPDVLYSFWGSSIGYETILLKRKLPGTKAVVKLHCLELYIDQHPCLWQAFRTPYAREADLLCFIAEEGRQYYRDNWPGVPEERMRVGYLGTADRSGGRIVEIGGKGALRVCSCAYLMPVKRIGCIADAIALLDTIKIDWLHIGYGALLEEVRQRAHERLDDKANVRWTLAGRVENADIVPKYLDWQPDVFLSVSSAEGLPVSMMEAASAGIPILAANVGGVSEIVSDGETGYLLPADTSAQVAAEALMRYAAMPDEEKRAMGARARQLWEKRFNGKANAERFAAALDEL